MNLDKLVKDVLELARLRREEAISRHAGNATRRAITESLTIKLFEGMEDDLVQSLAPVFKKQVDSIISNLEEKEVATIDLLFDPDKWIGNVINQTLPALALGMARAGMTQLFMFGIDPRKDTWLGTKQTGSDWVEEGSEDYDDLLGAFSGSVVGTEVNMIFMQGLPEWMKVAIVRELRNSFSQDYWREISRTTGGDASKILEDGLSRGWSIRRMAKEIAASMGTTTYTKMRARRIAITESGNALNSLRSASIDQLAQELGPAIPMRKTWFSVLIDTTRAAHADLDGTPADDEGMWNLNGVLVPWPGHTSLPVEDRANCLCSIISELGITDEEARIRIEEHRQRVELTAFEENQ